MLPDLGTLATLVREAARAEIVPRFRHTRADLKGDGSLVTEADTAMQARLSHELTARWPAYALLGEEMEAPRQQAILDDPGPGLWVLDPLDGTTNFATGLPYFAVSLALVDAHGPLLGVVHDPIRDETFTALRGKGAWLDGRPLRPAGPPAAPSAGTPATLAACVAEVDLKRLPKPLAARIAADHPFASQRQFGAAALDGCWLAAGRFHLYLHGGQQLWDYAAASLILAEAGGRAHTLDGEPLFTASLEKRSVVAACDAALCATWYAWLRQG